MKTCFMPAISWSNYNTNKKLLQQGYFSVSGMFWICTFYISSSVMSAVNQLCCIVCNRCLKFLWKDMQSHRHVQRPKVLNHRPVKAPNFFLLVSRTYAPTLKETHQIKRDGKRAYKLSWNRMEKGIKLMRLGHVWKDHHECHSRYLNWKGGCLNP